MKRYTASSGRSSQFRFRLFVRARPRLRGLKQRVADISAEERRPCAVSTKLKRRDATQRRLTFRCSDLATYLSKYYDFMYRSNNFKMNAMQNSTSLRLGYTLKLDDL